MVASSSEAGLRRQICHFFERKRSRQVFTAIFDSHRLVNVARVAIDALENKALWWIDVMVVGLLKQTLSWNVVHIVLVRRIA